MARSSSFIHPLWARLAALTAFVFALMMPLQASAQAAPKIKMAYAKCAHCLSMALVPGLAKGLEAKARIADLLDIRINSVERLKDKIGPALGMHTRGPSC